MKKSNRFLALIAALPVAAALSTAPAHADGFGGLGSLGGDASSLLSGSGMSVPSVSSLAPSNVTGLLSYCVQNNYLQGNSPSTLLSSLKQKAGLDTSSSQYSNGQNGILDTGNGNTFSLATLKGNLKQKITTKVCNAVLKQGKSLL